MFFGSSATRVCVCVELICHFMCNVCRLGVMSDGFRCLQVLIKLRLQPRQAASIENELAIATGLLWIYLTLSNSIEEFLRSKQHQASTRGKLESPTIPTPTWSLKRKPSLTLKRNSNYATKHRLCIKTACFYVSAWI